MSNNGIGARPESLPVAVIGAGPIGLAAAAHLAARETPFVVLEAGDGPGAAVNAWRHVRVFSPWRYNVDPLAATLLAQAGWREPVADHLPTGAELVRDYLAPLAELPALRPHLRFGARVTAVARLGFDKMKTPGRERAPFLVHLRTGGRDEMLLARAVIDASGTWQSPNPLGAAGVPALGERDLVERIAYGIPDVAGEARARYAGRRVLVVGAGHSAFNVLLDLAALAEQAPATRVTWAIRRAELGALYGGGAADALPARAELGARLRGLVDSGRITLVTGFRTARVVRDGDGVVVMDDAGRRLPPVDEIVASTGFRPDLAPLQELRLALDPSVESPAALASLIDPNIHSCGTVPPHGAAELQHPEADFYVVGMKSYGRAPTFLMLTGYEQVRSVVCALTGDEAGARTVELTLPETGVCSSAPAAAAAGASACCAVEVVPVKTAFASVPAAPRCCGG